MHKGLKSLPRSCKGVRTWKGKHATLRIHVMTGALVLRLEELARSHKEDCRACLGKGNNRSSCAKTRGACKRQ